MKPFNIILITIDCLRYDRLNWPEQKPIIETVMPAVSAIARRGVSFSQAYTVGCWTQAAFPGLMTSTFPAMYDGCLGPLSTNRPYLPALLKESGYNTAVVQASPLLGAAYGYDRGVDHLVEVDPPWPAPGWHYRKGVQRLLRLPAFQRLVNLIQAKSGWPAPVYAVASQITDRVFEVANRLAPPYFLWVHYMDAHWPYHLEEYLDSPGAVTEAWFDRYLAFKSGREFGWPYPGEGRLQRWIKMYDQSLGRVDREVGRLLDHLLPASTHETFVVIASDHGEEFYEHGKLHHSDDSLYQEIIHVPLVMAWPGGPSSRVVDTPVSLLDVAPTLLELLELPIPGSMLGKSVLPEIIGLSKEPVKIAPVIAEGRWEPETHRIALVLDDYKYIVDLRYPDKYEIYNLSADPAEAHNLADTALEQKVRFEAILAQYLAMVRESELEAGTRPDIDQVVIDRLRDMGYIDLF